MNHPCVTVPARPPSMPLIVPNQENLVTNTATSVASNARNSRHDGSASANHGSSHRLYWGE